MAIFGGSNKLFKITKHLPSRFNIHQRFASTDLMKVLCEMVPKERARVAKFRKECGSFKTGETTIAMMYGGMRGIRGMVWEPSSLDPENGIRFRGMTIEDCREKLPGAIECGEPLPESIWWLLVTGKVPTPEQTKWVTSEWGKRSEIPGHVTAMLKAFPKTLHPMTQLSCAVNALNHDSKFAEAYANGAKKDIYWEFVYEDSMNLLAKLPGLAALIYNNTYKDGKEFSKVDPKIDWSANFAKLMGFEDPIFHELMRLYLTIHCDHEGGNVSAHTAHLVGSALSDPYLSYAAGLNGLAGPLHGLANQEVLIWLMKLEKELGKEPSEDKLKDFIQKTLDSGQVVPGYGHAVLRKTDPRYTVQSEFAKKHLPDNPLYKLVSSLYKVVPPVLQKLGKVANPWPNVDAHSGVLLMYFGMKEMKFYTVLFGVSRAIGVLASSIWSRALGLPIERPKSMSTNDLMKLVEGGDAKKKKGDAKKKK